MVASTVMSEAFVDVTWRGLEVGKRIKLRAIHPGDGYIDHTTPMPVGSRLAIRTDEGVEIAVTVRRVHEQTGGVAETPGMEVVPVLEGAAAAWWQARAEAAPVLAAAAAPTPPPAEAIADPRAAITSKPTLTMTAVEVQRALGAVKGEAEDAAEGARTEVMAAVDPALIAGLEGGAGAAGAVDSDGLVDDGRRTQVMSAVDVSAIVEAAGVETSGGTSAGDDDAGDGPSGDGPSGDGASGDAAGPRGKRKRGGRRSKRNTRA